MALISFSPNPSGLQGRNFDFVSMKGWFIFSTLMQIVQWKIYIPNKTFQKHEGIYANFPTPRVEAHCGLLDTEFQSDTAIIHQAFAGHKMSNIDLSHVQVRSASRRKNNINTWHQNDEIKRFRRRVKVMCTTVVVPRIVSQSSALLAVHRP